MSSEPRNAASKDRDWRQYACRTAFTLCGMFAAYVLSFGPVFNLTTTKMGAGYMRPARFPSWANTVNTLYSPLIRVLTAYPQRMPQRALAWYVRLSDFGPSMELDYGDPKKLEADLREAVAKVRKERR